MASVVANEAEQAAGRGSAAADARAMIDPELFMAARRGDTEQLRKVLNDGGDEQVELTAVAPAAAAVQVVVEVNPPRPALTVPSSSSASTLLQLLDGVTSNEGDSLLHVVAASGDGDEFLRFAEMIHGNKGGLLVARNNRGDTPLHCAAGAGHDKMISRLVDLEKGGETAVRDLLRTRNKDGETALHHAVRAASIDCIDKLINSDSELACTPLEEGASPLYLAISLGDMKIARHLIDESKGKLSCSGPDGRNVFHAAVSHAQALPMLLEWFKDPKADVQEGGHHVSSVPSISQLTVQRDKQTGSTPLHLAASLEGWPDAKILSKCFPNIWPRPKSTLTLLLDANTCVAYQPDTQGLYPIHIAALSGSLDQVKILLRRCPECATLRDGKGRTFLHVAVEKTRHMVVQYICGPMPKKFSLLILNAQDNNGNTALHRAVHVGNLRVFNCLIRNMHVHLNILNKDALTPLDLSWCGIPPLFYYGSNPMCLIQVTLQYVGASCGGGRPDLLSEKHIPKADNDRISTHLTNAAQVMGIVSVLVATVTFASAFTLPGGYVQSGSHNAGAPLLAGSYAFDSFILSDTLAFICSCLATFSLIFAGVPAMDISIRLWYFEISAQLLRSSGRSLVVAFTLGLYLVLAPVAHTTAIVICAIISISSLYGNSEAWQFLAAANTARARLGTRMPLAWTCVIFYYNVFGNLLLHFWPFIIIFGLPATWN